MKKPFLAVLTSMLLMMCHSALADDNEGVNGIYARMSLAYTELDSAAFADIYTADGVYLRSGDNPMRVGVDAIIENYETFFSQVREEGGKRQLLFRIVARHCSASVCSDVGWYKHSQFDSDGKLLGISYGRFLTTPTLGDDGLWRFHADLDTGAEEVHWNSAVRIPGLHFDD